MNLPTVTQSGKVLSNTIYFSQMHIHLIPCKKNVNEFKFWTQKNDGMGLGDNQESNYIHHILSFKEGDKSFHSLNNFLVSLKQPERKSDKGGETERFDLRTKLIAVSCLLPIPLNAGTSAKLLSFSSSVLICQAGCDLVQS